ncbi:uncharacterized protein PAC_06790 [Phialocephala subalpina]|uniref:Uncharacterized protein n=1 Tax=Phialocephala subalpina TaxID=576137 RepID=A0A1L7WVU5_9HELO|nr:uncharacterized protein PAC_06790 [Phialocephala subalpina]
MADFPSFARPPTPQTLLHRLPDKPSESSDSSRKPSKYIIIIIGSTGAAGKVQISRSTADALSCQLCIADSKHDSAAKAAIVGASEPNEARYQRMWLSKMTRTGLLFPDESRPANDAFSGFGGTSSTSTSRRGSAGSIDSSSSNPWPPSQDPPPSASTSGVNAVFATPESERLRSANPVLMVLTHPKLETWHKRAIRTAVGDYSIGVIFVPLESEEDEEEDLPVLRPLDPRTMTSFPMASFGTFATKARGWGNLDEEMKLHIDTDADIAGKTAEIIEGVREVIGIDK